MNIMRSTPNYFAFRRWLNGVMKDDPSEENHFHAGEVYENNLLDGFEVIPAALILSYGASMLEDARGYYQKRAYSSKTPVFLCGLDDIENYDPDDFELDDFIPDFSTLQKTANCCPDEGHTQIFFYVIRPDEWQFLLSEPNYKCIAMSAPSWFGSQFNMIYSKKMWHDEKSCFVEHDLVFYHKDVLDYFPFEMNKWIFSATESLEK